MSAVAKAQTFGLRIARDERHEYTVDDRKVPGVTKILRAYLRFANAPRDVMEAALLRGSAVHKAVELDAKGALDPESVDDVVAPYFRQWTKFLAESNFRPLLAEFMVASKRYSYAGELDLAGRLRNTGPEWIDLIDVKTGVVMPVTVGLQTAGYAKALHETMIAADPAAEIIRIRRHCLHLTKTNYRLVPLNSADDWPVFLSALNMWRFTDEHCRW